MDLYVNDTSQRIESLEELDERLQEVEAQSPLDLSISVAEGPSLQMLRSESHAFLMYLREPGDSGFVSGRSRPMTPTVKFTLGNGQIDEYPRAWCIPVEECFKAFVFFYVNNGLKPTWIQWHES